MSDVSNAGESTPGNASAERSDAGVGGSVHEETTSPDGAEGVQTEPVLEQNAATTGEKLDGIAAQTRVDLGEESQERYEEVIRQRLSDAEIQVTDDDVSDLARRASPGGGGSGGSGV